jgi:hypothetical protein
MTHLEDYSGTENDGKYSVSFHADVIDRINEAGPVSPNGNTWIEYARDKGWNV